MFKELDASELSIGDELNFVLPDRCQIELAAVSVGDVLVYGRRAEDTRLILIAKNPPGIWRPRLVGFNLLQVKGRQPVTVRLEIADRPEHERGISDETHIAIPPPQSPLQRLRAAMAGSIMRPAGTLLEGGSPYEVDDDDYLFEEDFLQRQQPGGSETTGIERPEGEPSAGQPEVDSGGEKNPS